MEPISVSTASPKARMTSMPEEQYFKGTMRILVLCDLELQRPSEHCSKQIQAITTAVGKVALALQILHRAKAESTYVFVHSAKSGKLGQQIGPVVELSKYKSKDKSE